MAQLLRTFVLASLVYLTTAIPSPILEERSSTTTLSSSQISAFKPYAYYASAAYCEPDKTASWDCGGAHFVICARYE